MAYKRNVEIFEEAYEKKDAKSVVSYVARDGRKRYIAGSKNPSGSDTTFVPDESGNVVFTDGSGTGHELLTARGLGNAQVIETTWADLKDARDDGELIAGSLYRITDYNCTTTQENTQSAGHQFDIVLLALSANKLAEEGWAMEHPTDVYDVTFSDGVTKKCYYYRYQSGIDRHDVLVYTDTLLGLDYNSGTDDDLDNFINKTNKTINLSSTPITSELLNVPDLTYNYFQNSKLEAWKVWYCLDNDTDRFAWAMDIQPASAKFNVDGEFNVTRDEEKDRVEGGETYFAWTDILTNTWYTLNEEPSVGDDVYDLALDVSGSVVSYIPSQEGRGVIYRLIDEFNNDVAYDFKSIQFIRKLTDGAYDPDTGTDTWVYTFNGWDSENSTCVDATTDITLGFNDIHNNMPPFNSLSDNVFLGECSDIKIMDTACGLITLSNCLSTTLISTYIFELADENGAIYIGNKKVLTEE